MVHSDAKLHHILYVNVLSHNGQMCDGLVSETRLFLLSYAIFLEYRVSLVSKL